MTRTKLLSILVVLASFYCFEALFGEIASVNAQPPEPIDIIHIDTNPDGPNEAFNLNVYFIITDQFGRPVSKATNTNIDSATLQLLWGENAHPVTAEVADPATDFYIALLIDASGSMKKRIGNSTREVIDDVKLAARSVIVDAPPNARFAIYQFSENEKPEQIIDFLSINDQTRLLNHLSLVQAISGSGTCLYDAVDSVIKDLAEVAPNPKRRAIILFTDGKDERRGSDGPCSKRDARTVIGEAQAFDVPIHTIGLCDDGNCNNINEADLRSLAQETFAWSATGGVTELQDLFEEIMESLDSQWVVRANVYPGQGDNQAALRVKLSDDNTFLQTDKIRFASPKDYNAPAPPASATLDQFTEDKSIDVDGRLKSFYYRFNLDVSSADPQSIHQINIQVENSNEVIVQQSLVDYFSQVLEIPIDATTFDPGDYRILVKALDANGQVIPDIEGNPILVNKSFTHAEVPSPDQIAFEIKTIKPDFETGLLTIELSGLPDLTTKDLLYSGFIRDEAKQPIADLPEDLLKETQIQLPLPDAMRGLEVERNFEGKIVIRRANTDITSEAQLEFPVTPPPPVGLLTRVGNTLITNPAYLISIIVIVAIVAVWIIYQKRPTPKTDLPAPMSVPSSNPASGPRPPVNPKTEPFFGPENLDNDETLAYTPTFVDLRVRLKVVFPTALANQGKVFTNFPIIIGRKQTCHFLISEDNRVSGEHAKIITRGEKVFITDMGSTNGTFIKDQKLAPNQETQLIGSTTIRLGPQLQLELEIQNEGKS